MDRIPILRLGSVLIVSVQGDLADAVAVALRHDVGAAVSSGGITGVILDVSGVAIVDSYLGRVLTEIAADCSLLGASTVVAGIKPAVAITLVEMGLRLDGARTARSLEAAVAMLGADVAPTAILRERAMSLSTAPAALPVRSDVDLIAVREATRTAAADAGFSLVNQTKLVTAVSELARNAVVHGGGGEVRIDSVQQGSLRGVRLVVSDQGPGIEDIAQALTDGHTTGRGLGLGLGGAKRLVNNDFTIESAPGQGTTVTIAMWATPGLTPIQARLPVRP